MKTTIAMTMRKLNSKQQMLEGVKLIKICPLENKQIKLSKFKSLR